MAKLHHPEKGPFLNQLQVGDRFIGFYVLRSKNLDQFRDPGRGHYLTLIIGDQTGTAVAHVWEGAEKVADSLSEKSIIKVDGDVENYQGRKQVRVLQVRNAKEGEYDLRDMLRASLRDPEVMFADVLDFIELIKDESLRKLVDFFFLDQSFQERLKQAPAARTIHHAYLGGLLEHLQDVMRIAETVIELYPQIDPDMLRTGALLHDMGKLREYVWDFDIDFSDDGRLLGHITMADEMITDALASMPDFPEELALRLRHMLLAHHGRLEWGSPRAPMTLEAIALHHIDNLDAQINRFSTLLEQRDVDDERWTPYERSIDRKLFIGGGITETRNHESSGDIEAG